MPLLASAVHETMQRAWAPASPNGSANAGKLTLVFRIRSRTNPKNILKEHRLIRMPAVMTHDTEARGMLYYTKRGIYADTPLQSNIGATFFTIKGDTGFHGIPEKTPPGANDRLSLSGLLSTFTGVATSIVNGRSKSGSLIDGAAAIKDFEDTIRGYFFPSGQSETQAVPLTQDLQLEFLNLSAPISKSDSSGHVGWLIFPHRNLVSLSQDAQHPFIYNYTFQFAAIELLKNQAEIRDTMSAVFGTKAALKTSVIDRLTKVIKDVTKGVNTISHAVDTFLIQNITGPISTLLTSTSQLRDAVGGFVGNITQKIAYPLYAKSVVENLLTLPSHSVTTLEKTAVRVGAMLTDAVRGTSVSGTSPATSLTAGIDDFLTLKLNDEAAFILELGTCATGGEIAASIQAGVRARAPVSLANASAYREFVATYSEGQYLLASGTTLAENARVEVVVSDDPDLDPHDASVPLKLGTANGGQEQYGSTGATRALMLLRELILACQRLEAFPEYFAENLQEQTQLLAQFQLPGTGTAAVSGEQDLRQTLILPGDSLQAIAARSGIPWERLAVTNHLVYPYVLELPTTIMRGRLTAATPYDATDARQSLAANIHQGQRFDILSGSGAGQSRRILANAATSWTLDRAWNVTPDDTSEYAIRAASNPIIRSGIVTASSPTSLTDSAILLVPFSQQGYVLRIATGPAAGQRRRVTSNGEHSYLPDIEWDAPPEPGDVYIVTAPEITSRRFRIVGETLTVPRAAAVGRIRSIRSGLEDIGSFTGQDVTTETKLFGRDLLLQDGSLVWDASRNDLAVIVGLPNLRQAILMKLNAGLGEWEQHPTLGSYLQESMGLTASLPIHTELLHSVERTVREDPRIARMKDAQLLGEAGQVAIAFHAEAVNGQTIDRVVVR